MPWVGAGGIGVPKWCMQDEKSGSAGLAKSADQYAAGHAQAKSSVPVAPRGSLVDYSDRFSDTTQLLEAALVPTQCWEKPHEDEMRVAREQNDDLVAKMRFLEQVPLLRRLPRDQYPMLASACVRATFATGEVVIREGEAGQSFFVIESGMASVTKGGNRVALLRAGDYFGERALLFQEARIATVVAVSELQCYEITRKKFQDLGLNSRLHFANRRAIAAGSGSPAAMAAPLKAPSPKTPEERELITAALRANPQLKLLALGTRQVKRMVDIAWREEIEAGCELLRAGCMANENFYIVQDGSFEKTTVHPESSRRGSSKQHLITSRRRSVEETVRATCLQQQEGSTTIPVKHGPKNEGQIVERGGSFGELTPLQNSPVSASWRAQTKAVVWVLDRHNFKNMLIQVAADKLQEYVKYLDIVTIFSSLHHEERETIARALVEMRFSQGQEILRQGEPGNAFYVLFDGEVEVLRDGEKVDHFCASIDEQTAQYFGERALLEEQERTATVRVTSEIARVLVLDRETFTLLLGPLKDIIRADANGERQWRGGLSGPPSRSGSKAPPGALRIKRSDLRSLGLLGCGGFASVELCEHKVTGQTYALKKVSKGLIVDLGLKDSLLNEKNILFAASSPFIVRLHECYTGAQSLYLLLDVALGGELYAIYKHHGLDGSAAHARYYTGSVLLAFEHLHARHVIYRDLKPENLLLTEKGHLKVTDMGLAKFVVGKSFTCCGTPDYFAPELIASIGHTSALDWWTWGILLYELMCGVPPFESERPMSTYRKVLEGIELIVFPAQCEGSVGDLVRKLLEQEPSLRLPMRPGGTQNVKDHVWYEGFSWQQLENRTMEVPYLPTVASNKDLTNFGDWDAVRPRQVPFVDDGSDCFRDFATVDEPEMAASDVPEDEEGSHDGMSDSANDDDL